MRAQLLAIAAALLAGCATPGAYNELQAAKAALDLHAGAPIYLNVDLIDTAGTTEAQREPQILGLRPRAEECGAAFNEAFALMIDQAATKGQEGIIYAIGEGRRLDEGFDECVRRSGLTGYPEFKVGEQFKRTTPFLRGYWDAGVRYAIAQGEVSRQSTASGLAFAAGVGAAGRAATTYQPPPRPVIAPTIRQPIRCTTQSYGGALHTTCQ
jgi:hypothetical protein